MAITSSLVDQLASRRKAMKLLQGELGRRAGIGQAHVSRIEAGLGDPRMSTLVEMARGLEADLVLVPRELIGPVKAMIASLSQARADDGDAAPEERPLYSLDDDN
jgi:HTH-type transcriptional regulator / antitoxin HipB